MDLFQVVTWLWGHVLVTPMTNFMVLVARLSFGNFGIAVIVFTLLMRGATWPLTRKQLHATRAMQSLQPRIQAIQKQHKDPKRRSEETMKLYREAGVSPLGCVWPMLIQFPIWIALYQSIRFTLGATPESLLDLSQRLYPWGFLRTAVPLEKHFLWLDLGRPDHTLIMAVLVGATTWIQQRMTTPPTATADPQQQSVNQTMMFMMPLMFAFFTLQFPSGLALYWLSTNVVSIVLQYFYMRREFSWKQLFSTSTARAPAVRGPAKEVEAEEDTDEAAVAAEPADTHRRRRRRRRGRRRR